MACIRSLLLEELAQAIPEITECHRVTGEDCIILRVFLKEFFKLGSRTGQISGSRANHDIYCAIVAWAPEKSPASTGCLGP